MSISGWGEIFSKWETSVQLSAVPQLTVSLWWLQTAVNVDKHVKHAEEPTVHSFLAWFVPRLYFNSYKMVETTWRWRRDSERLQSICWWYSMWKDSLTVDSGNSCAGDILKTTLGFSLGIGNAGGSCRIFWTFHGLCVIIRIPVV